MKQRILAALCGAVCIFLFAQAYPADARPSLDAVLSQIRSLSEDEFVQLVAWAGSGAPGPAHRITQLDWTESDIDGLTDSEKNAVRSALVNGQIRYKATPEPTPTPQVWRDIAFTTPTLGENPTEGNIQMIGGAVTAKLDGHEINACVSFKNVASKTATEVFFAFPLTDAVGATLATLTLDRTGTFSPNIGIYSRGGENCVNQSSAVAALPILQAQYAAYHVIKVVYEDGTVWTANPSPSKH